MITYALDTNTVIHLLRNTASVISHFNVNLEHGIPIVIPSYVDYEIRRGLRYSNAIAKERMYGILCKSCEFGEMSRGVWFNAVDIYVNLRQKGFTVGDADILIAAFCIENQYTLVTNNTKDFENIEDIELVDWVE
jgi:tRNA(fMet)-specific endonuclease VapC